MNFFHHKAFCFLSLFLGSYFIPLFGTSLLEKTEYPAFCQRAVDNQEIFANFKRDPIYQNAIENVSHELGEQYLNLISLDYPELIPLFEQFRQNDTIGSPLTYNYGKNYGRFSPTTLSYIKIAGDLKSRFGDLKQKHIAEIGRGCGTLCKILFDMGGFASYTIIDLPQCNALTKKYLEQFGINNVIFIDKGKLSSLQNYDLVISNFSFSECDLNEQNLYLENLISSTPCGYLAMNFIASQFGIESLTSEEIIAFLYRHGKRGKVVNEKPTDNPDNLLITWDTPTPSHIPTKIKERTPLKPSHSSQKGSAITYTFSGGRFGDNLVAYFHARWLSYKYGLPLLYKPFPFSDQLMLNEMDQPFSNSFQFKKTLTYQSEADLPKESSRSTLFLIPFFPEERGEWVAVEKGRYALIYCANFYPFSVDWDDPQFRAECLKCLTPKKPAKTISLPKDRITVGVHVRRGSGPDGPHFSFPIKIPKSDNYYLQQIQRISKIFKDLPLYVHIFTDYSNPEEIVEYYKKALNNPNIEFGYRKVNPDNSELLNDFFSIPLVDCLIIPASNFSLIHAKLKDFAILVLPLHVNLQCEIDEVELTFNPLCQPEMMMRRI